MRMMSYFFIKYILKMHTKKKLKKIVQTWLQLIVQMKGGGRRNVMIKKQLKNILCACW